MKVIAFSKAKSISIAVIIMVILSAFAIPAFAQDETPDAQPEVSQECRDALQALRDAGEEITADNVPESCPEFPILRRLRDRFQNRPQLPEECRTQIEALREAGEEINKEVIEATCGIELPEREGRPELTDECKAQIQALRDAGEEVNKEVIEATCDIELPDRPFFRNRDGRQGFGPRGQRGGNGPFGGRK